MELETKRNVLTATIDLRILVYEFTDLALIRINRFVFITIANLTPIVHFPSMDLLIRGS